MKNSILSKFSLALLMIFCYTVSKAQLLTNNGQQSLITNSNVILDGSTNFSTEAGAAPYIGKGIIIPSVDLVNFVFDLTLADGSTFPTYFDGMIVYNNATGTTLTTGNRSSTAISVVPGFYYFSNPNGATNSNVFGGVWKSLGGVSLTGTAPIAVTSGVISLNDSGVTTPKIADNAVTSAKILDGTIVSADLSAAAGITNGQLANNSITINGTSVALGGSTTITASPTNSTLNSTNLWVGNASNQAAAVAMSGDATMSNTGVVTIANNAVTSAKILDGTIATSDVANNAITGSKLENNIALPGTASMTLPSGTTAQRPVTAVAGMSRFNTTDNIMEYYNGTAWIRPTAGTTYSGSTSIGLNGTSFERAALTGHVTAAANSNATTIANNVVTSAMIVDGTIQASDLSNSAAISNSQLANSSITINGTSVSLGGSTTITASPTNSTLNSTNLWVGNAANQATPVVMSGDATMSNTGVVTIANNAVTSAKILDGTIATSDVANNAITGSKLENNIALPGTASMTLPSGTTAQRPVTAVAGMSRFNTTDNIMEYYNGTAWIRPTAGTTYSGSTSTILNGTSFERAALTGDVTAAANSNATTIADNAVTSAKILDGTIVSADLSAAAGITNGQLANNSITINGNSVALGGTTNIMYNNIRGNVVTVTNSSYTLASSDYAIITNNSTGVTITMPDLTLADAGRIVYIFNNNTAAVANSWGGTTPTGVSTLNQFRAMALMWTGSIWVIMGK